MELRADETVIWKGRPSWRSMIAFYIKWGILALLPVIIVALLNGIFDADINMGIATAITVIGIVLVIVASWLFRAGTQYLLTDQRIMVRHGILSRRERSASLDRVQNVNTSQTFVQRLLGTGNVDFDTAGSDASEADFTFAGIDDPHGLRDRLDIAHKQSTDRDRQTGGTRPDPL